MVPESVIPLLHVPDRVLPLCLIGYERNMHCEGLDRVFPAFSHFVLFKSKHNVCVGHNHKGAIVKPRLQPGSSAQYPAKAHLNLPLLGPM